MGERTYQEELRQYESVPEEGVFEAVQKRVVRRRRARQIGGVAAVAAVLLVAAAVVLPGDSATEVAQQDNFVTEACMNVETHEATEIERAMPALQSKQSDVIAQTVIISEVPKESEEEAVAVAQEVEVADEEVITVTPAVQLATVAEKETPRNVEGVSNTEKEPIVEEKSVAPPTAERTEVKGPTTSGQKILIASNTIIPSSDQEQARYFSIMTTEKLTHFSVVIFNRRGQQIYSSQDIDFRWDGTYKGAQVAQGAYVWVATFFDENGHKRQEKGTVTVLR